MDDSFERGDSYEAYEMFDAIHAAGMSPAELMGDMGNDSPLEGHHGAGAPPLVSYGASSTLSYEAGADAIPTSVTMPAGAEPAMPAPEPSPAPQELGSPLSGRAAESERSATHDQSPQSNQRKRVHHMDRWEDSATGAMAMDEARKTSAASATAPSASGAAPSATASATTPAAREWNEEEMEQAQEPSRALRVALIAGAASLTALAIAGGVTWLIIQRRRTSAARELERAIAASRLLRMTPAVARPQMLEATQAGASARELARQTAAETAHMARALREAAALSTSTARDYAAERAANAQETISGALDTISEALDTARGSASTALQAVSKTSPFQAQWLARAFNAGRYAGRMEQRLR